MCDEADKTFCCRLVPEIAEVGDQFDCARCVFRRLDEDLDHDNREAWHLYRQVCSRFTVETSSASVVLDRITRDLDAEDFRLLMWRFELLYSVMNPKKRQATDTHA